MDVWIALFRYFPHGGLQRDALRTAAAFVAAGHRVTVVCARWGAEESAGLSAGVTLRVLGVSGATNHRRVERFNRALLAAHRAAGAPFLLGFDKLAGLDAYFCADVCFAARARRSRPAIYRWTPRYLTFTRLEEAIFSPSAHVTIFSLAPQVEREYRAEYDTPADRFVALPPGVSPDRCATQDSAEIREQARAAHGVDADAIVLLFVAANFEQKGLDRVLRGIASQSIEDRTRVRLLVAGPGDIPRFERLAESHGLAGATTFLSGTDDIPALLQGADLLVHPARVENTGTVLVEALVAGLPVLCSGECGYADHVRSSGAGGALDVPFEQSDFDTALATLCSADRSRLRARALAYAAETDLSSMHATIVRTVEGVPALRAIIKSADPIASLEALALETLRETPQRRTFRFEVGGRSYFAKIHRGWERKGAVSDLLRGVKPAPGACDEARVLERLATLGVRVPTVAAAADLGGRVLGRRSYLITEDVGTQTTLDELWDEARWGQLDASVRSSLVDQVGRIAGTLHGAGINHRDLYLVHFHVDDSGDAPELILLDLHRAQQRRRVPRRWLVKDLAGLLVTASVQRRPSRATLARFVRAYSGGNLRRSLTENAALWAAVEARAARDVQRKRFNP